MSAAVKVARYLLVNDATIGGLISTRCFPADAVPSGCRRPYCYTEITSNLAEKDLAGTTHSRVVTIQLTIVSDTYATARIIADRLPTAIGQGPRTVNGVAVLDSDADDLGEEIDGPIDLDGGQGFVATATIQIEHV